MSDAKNNSEIKSQGEGSDTQRRQFRFNTLDFVVSVLDSHSGNFRAHAHAVARYARVLGKMLGLDASEIDEIVMAAYLHDMHKLVEGKQNSIDIASIMKTLEAPASLATMIHHMHERFDGSGEPDHLAGEQIPLGSRILACANMLDEISHGKVDTQVIRRDEAFESLRKRGGRYLDPHLVGLLIDGLKQQYRQYYKEQEARIVVAIEDDGQRFFLANLLMESGYSVSTTREPKESFSTVSRVSPHLILVTAEMFAKLGEICRKQDVMIQKAVIVVGPREIAKELQSNEFIAVEDFLLEPIDAVALVAKVEKIAERVLKQETQTRESASFFEKAGNFVKAADLYRELGDARRAAEMYEKGASFAPAGEMFELLGDSRRAGFAFENAGNLERAAKNFADAQLYDERARVFEKRGDVYYSAKNLLFQKQTSAALDLFRKIDPGHPKFRRACYYMAKIYMDRREWANAQRYCERVVDGQPVNAENIRAYYNLAVTLEYLKKLPQALGIYEKILGVDYNFRDVYKRIERLRRKVQVLEQRTKLEHKVKDFNAIAQAKPDDSQNIRYEKIKVLGRGGMGVVYEATDLVLGRKVALKVLSAAFRDDKLVVDTFLREAKAAAMLNHVNIVTIYDAGIESNNYFIAMEAIQGQTLKEILQSKRFSIASILRLMRQICSGLKYAHSKKIIHRDLTNSNIMLTEDNIIKIMDFGLARIVEHLMSEQSIIGGTPSYMAPEQVQGAPIDQRADIYGLGVNLFELSTGRLPFIKGDLGYHHVHTMPPDPRDLNPKIPVEMSKAILKCLEKAPADRFQSVEELAQALKI